MGVIGNRLLVLRRFAAWLVSKWFMRLWAALGAYDLVCSQLLPDALLARAPTLKTVIELTAGLMTLTGWVIVGAALTILAGAEYVFRITSARPDDRDSAPDKDLIQLSVCARIAYEAVERRLLGRLARGSRGGPLAFMAQKLFYAVPLVLGKHPSSTRLLPVNEIAGHAFRFSEDGGSLLNGEGPVITELCVKRDDFDAALTCIRESADGETGGSWDPDEMVPLREAVGIALTATRDSRVAAFNAGSDEEQTVFGYFSAMLNHKTPIYGKTPPATDWVRLNRVDLSSETLVDMKSIKPHHRPVRMTDLSLRRRDITDFAEAVMAEG